MILGVVEPEVVAGVGVDRHVVALDVTHDGEVVVSLGEDSIEPLFPCNWGDGDIEADLSQRRSDELTGVGGVIYWWHIERYRCSRLHACGDECLTSSADVVRRHVGEIFEPRIRWWNEAADLGSVTGPGGVDQRLLVDCLSHRSANFHIIEWRTGVVHSEGDFAVG